MRMGEVSDRRAPATRGKLLVRMVRSQLCGARLQTLELEYRHVAVHLGGARSCRSVCSACPTGSACSCCWARGEGEHDQRECAERHRRRRQTSAVERRALCRRRALLVCSHLGAVYDGRAALSRVQCCCSAVVVANCNGWLCDTAVFRVCLSVCHCKLFALFVNHTIDVRSARTHRPAATPRTSWYGDLARF